MNYPSPHSTFALLALGFAIVLPTLLLSRGQSRADQIRSDIRLIDSAIARFQSNSIPTVTVQVAKADQYPGCPE